MTEFNSEKADAKIIKGLYVSINSEFLLFDEEERQSELADMIHKELLL